MITKIAKLIENKKAILVDLDGTLMNSEPIHAKALALALLEINIKMTPEELEKNYAGLCDHEVWEKILKKDGLLSYEKMSEKKNHYFEKIVDELSPEELEKLITKGVKNFLKKLKRSGKKIGLVTSSGKKQTDCIIKKLKAKDLFDVVTTVEDIFLPKPAPSPYLFTMRKLGVADHSAIIFEDSITGLTSATLACETVIRIIGHNDPLKGHEWDSHKFKKLQAIDNFSGLF